MRAVRGGAVVFVARPVLVVRSGGMAVWSSEFCPRGWWRTDRKGYPTRRVVNPASSVGPQTANQLAQARARGIWIRIPSRARAGFQEAHTCWDVAVYHNLGDAGQSFPEHRFEFFELLHHLLSPIW